MPNTRAVLSVRTEALPNSRIIRFVASTNRVARDRGIIEPAAWDTREFTKNPVFLWAHQADQLPLGRVVKTETTPDGLIAEVEFAGEEQRNDRAETAYRMYRSGFLSAVSVGFTVRAQRDPTDEETRAGAQWVATKADLLEISAVPVPADPDALAISRAVKDGTIRTTEVAYLRSNWGEIDGWRELAKAAEDEIARTTATETAAGSVPVVARVDRVALPEEPAPAPETPEEPAEGQGIECHNCGTVAHYCAGCGASLDEREAPTSSNTNTSTESVTDSQRKTADAEAEGEPSNVSHAEWWKSLGELLTRKPA